MRELRAVSTRARITPASFVNHYDYGSFKEIEDLIATRQAKGYEQAIVLLTDLRDLAARGEGQEFQRSVEDLRQRHAQKPALQARLRKAGL